MINGPILESSVLLKQSEKRPQVKDGGCSTGSTRMEARQGTQRPREMPIMQQQQKKQILRSCGSSIGMWFESEIATDRRCRYGSRSQDPAMETDYGRPPRRSPGRCARTMLMWNATRSIAHPILGSSRRHVKLVFLALPCLACLLRQRKMTATMRIRMEAFSGSV